jgi:methyl-accepting chemotaxis protein
VKDTVTSGAGNVAEAAQKAKAPLIAGGATIAGVAGAIVLASRSGGRKVLGVQVGRRNGFQLPGRSRGLKGDARKIASAITDAAGRADRLGQRVSKVASTIRQVSETADDAAKKV